MANTLQTVDVATKIVAKEGLKLLTENLQFVKKINQQYSGEFGSKGKNAGSTVSVRVPSKSIVRTGRTFAAQNHAESKIDLAVGEMRGADFQFDSTELALAIDQTDVFSDRVLKGKIQGLASYIEAEIMTGVYKKVWNSCGTPGTDPATVAAVLSAGTAMNNAGASPSGRHLIINPDAQGALVNGLSGIFNNQTIVGKQYETGEMGYALGFNFAMSQIVPRHTVGAYSGTPLVDGASQTGASLVTNGWGNSITGVLKKGDQFTIAGVYQVSNPTGANATILPNLQRFLVTADANSGASTGPCTISISPSIVTSGAFQTVSASPADDAAITMLTGTASTSYAQNMAFLPDAFTVAFVDLPKYEGLAKCYQETYKGISMRVVSWYDGDNDLLKTRADVQYAYECLRPELACRVFGK